MGIGDWGLGIGDLAQSPIPNPQSTIPKSPFIIVFYEKLYFLNLKLKILYLIVFILLNMK